MQYCPVRALPGSVITLINTWRSTRYRIANQIEPVNNTKVNSCSFIGYADRENYLRKKVKDNGK
ncbi:hypothetical protein CK934_01420 [Chitinophaga sp. MD30]|nr:hypothetical protein CK934_01420 [Chitinophaga sp. MD30]